MTSSPDPDDFATHAETTGITVVSLFPSRGQAEAAIRDLKRAGFTDQEIGVVMRDPGKPGLPPDTGNTTLHAATVGVVSGSFVGGLIGLLGSLLVPGLGPLLLGGVLASTLTGAGVGAATGGLATVLVKLGVPESDAEHFERGLRADGVLLTVSAPPHRTSPALRIIQSHGADLGPRMTSHPATPDRS